MEGACQYQYYGHVILSKKLIEQKKKSNYRSLRDIKINPYAKVGSPYYNPMTPQESKLHHGLYFFVNKKQLSSHIFYMKLVYISIINCKYIYTFVNIKKCTIYICIIVIISNWLDTVLFQLSIYVNNENNKFLSM